jgi:hypothetical protein
VLVGVIVLEIALGVLGISKRVGGAAIEGGWCGYKAIRISAISVLLKYGYYTFLVGVLARLLAETNCVCFLR